MAADIEKELGLTSEFIAGGGGIFEVKLDGEVVFKNDPVICGVPDPSLVIEAVRDALG